MKSKLKWLPGGILLISLLVGVIYMFSGIFKPGYLIYVDITEGLTVSNLYQRYFYTYSNDIGESLAEKDRIPLFSLIFGLFNLLQMSDDTYIKIKFLVLVTLTLLAYGITTYKLYSRLFSNRSKSSILAATAVGLVFYISNYWFTNRLMHFYLFFSSVTIPITFYLTYSYLFSEKTEGKRLLLLLLLLAIFTATPHAILFEVLIMGILSLVYLIGHNPHKLQRLLQLVLFSFGYVLINAYWIVPFVVSKSVPDAIPSESIIEYLGKNASLINAIRLMGYLLTNTKEYFVTDQGLKMFQQVTSFLPLLVCLGAIISLVKKSKKTAIVMVFLLIAGTFLATSESFTNSLYVKIMFESPFKSVGWIFREVDKFGIIIAYLYALGMGVLLCTVKKKPVIAISLAAIFIIYANNIYFLNKKVTEFYTPQQIPQEFFEAHKFLKGDPQTFNTLWYPGITKATWAKTREIEYVFTNMISPKPAITTRSDINNYVEYVLKKENVYSIDVAKAMDIIGVKYIIMRKDGTSAEETSVNDRLDTQQNLEKVYTSPILDIYQNKLFTDIAKVYTQDLVTNMGLAVLKSNFMDTNKNLYFLDKPSKILLQNPLYVTDVEGAKEVAINQYTSRFSYPAKFSKLQENGNPGAWKFGSLENLTHAETKLFFGNKGMSIDQFDYRNYVLNAWEGYKKVSDNGGIVQNSITFSKHNNIKQDQRNYQYDTKEEDFIYEWNIIESDRFAITGDSILGIKLNVEVNYDLEPHFKLVTFSESPLSESTQVVYPNDRGLVDALVEIPKNATSAELRIFTRSTPGHSYAYKIKDLSITNESDNVEKISKSIPVETNCQGNCHLYARLLKSTIGGLLEVDVEGNRFSTNTLDNKDRYSWVYLGNFVNQKAQVEMKLINQKGFNSINAMVVLNDEENTGIAKYKLPIPKISEDKNGTKGINATVTEINPAKYKITLARPLGNGAILSFAKPYSQNWVLDGQKPAEISNGYINGWLIVDDLKTEYTVEYKPQRYFYLGSIVSAITFVGILGYLVVKSVLVRRSTSQG